MNLDVSAVQCKNFNPFFVNDLCLELFFDAIEDSDSNPVSKSPIDGGPFPVFLGKSPPCTSVFADVAQGSPKGERVDNDIATLLRKKMFDTFILLVWTVHGGR